MHDKKMFVLAAGSALFVTYLLTTPTILVAQNTQTVMPSSTTPTTAISASSTPDTSSPNTTNAEPDMHSSQIDTATEIPPSDTTITEMRGDAVAKEDVYTVPFYSQFNDISQSSWRKVACGIASLAMIIDFYTSNAPTADTLLANGIKTNAYTDDGWSHAGLIALSNAYGLNGDSHSLTSLTMDEAFATLHDVVDKGPVMVSVHYTFDPTNPIPHLVVVNGVKDGLVYYNDPAEAHGGGTISINKFQKAWKKRYIEIRPS